MHVYVQSTYQSKDSTTSGFVFAIKLECSDDAGAIVAFQLYCLLFPTHAGVNMPLVSVIYAGGVKMTLSDHRSTL